jgi:DNA repair protein SbcC/Rad50
MITKINLKNWRSHLDSTLEFSEGTNVLIGIVGAGKTSILDGICFALFGTFPNLNARKIKLEDTIMKKPFQQKTAEITVEFSLNGDDYKVTRFIEKGKTTAELHKNGKMVESPQTQRVTEEIVKILKINYDLFTRAVYSEQNQVDMFLTIPKGQRMKKIDELLSIDKFEKVRKNTVSIINKCFSQGNEKKKFIASLEEDKNLKNLHLIKKEIENSEQEKIQLREKLKSIQEKRLVQESKLKELKATEKRISEINEKINTLTALITSYKQDIDNLKEGLMEIAEKSDEKFEKEVMLARKETEEIKKNLDEEREKLIEMQKMLSSKSTQIKILEGEKIPNLSEKITEIKKIEAKLKRNPLEKLISNLDEKVITLENEKAKINKSEAQIEEISLTLKEMISIENKCPLCDQKMTEKKKNEIIRMKKMRIGKYESLKIDAEKNSKKMEKEIEKIREGIKNAEKLQTQTLGIDALKNDLILSQSLTKKLKAEITNYDTELKMMEKTIEMMDKNYEEKRSNLEEINKIYDRKKQLVEKTNKIKQSEKDMSDLQHEKSRFIGFTGEIIPVIEQEIHEIYGSEKTIETKMENISVLAKEKEKLIDELEKKQKLLENYTDEIKKLEIVAQHLQLFESSLEQTQNQLRKNFISAVNQAMDQIWEQLYPYKDFSSCRLGIEDDYVLQLLDETGWINVDGVVSGGERSIACLALRIAFSLVLAPQLRWLVLDEPTHNLDARTVEDLSTLLRDRIPEMVEQIFIITHDPALESAVSGQLYKLDREKHRNEPTRVLKIGN